jgi:tetratricopeptide (TPR) repeat protein
LISHARALAKVIDEFRFEFPDAARLMLEAGHYSEVRAQFAEAESLLKSALAIQEKVLGAEHPDVSSSLHDLAMFYNNNHGEFAEALPLLVRALAIGEKALGAEHEDVVNILSSLAGVYYNLDRYAEAESLLERAIAIGEKTLGAEHPSVASKRKHTGLAHSGSYA